MLLGHLGQLANETIGEQVFEELMVGHLTTTNKVSIFFWIIFIILDLVLIVTIIVWFGSKQVTPKHVMQQKQQQ